MCYHRSPCILRVGTKLRHTGQNYVVDSDVEAILEKTRPQHCIRRNQSVFGSEVLRCGNHGQTYDDGHHYKVLMIGKVDRRDNGWLGELQRRHHKRLEIRNLANRDLRNLSDEDLANRYWSAEPSGSPNWELVTSRAYILWRC